MTIPNAEYRVSRKKEKKHNNTCNNNNCIEQPFENNTHSGLEINIMKTEFNPLPPVSARCGYWELKTRVCGT